MLRREDILRVNGCAYNNGISTEEEQYMIVYLSESCVN